MMGRITRAAGRLLRKPARTAHTPANVGDMRHGITTAAATLAAAASATALFTCPAARADVDPTEYFNELRKDGFLVDGNQSYLLGLANIVCDMHNAGTDLSDIGDYIARRENLPREQGFTLGRDANIWICSQLHPRLVPSTPRTP